MEDMASPFCVYRRERRGEHEKIWRERHSSVGCLQPVREEAAVKEGILREGAAHFDVAWDYFSEKDGEVHHFDLCEECYDGVTREFLIEADKEERTELL